MNPNHHFSTPFNNANDVVNSSAPSNIFDTARVALNQTPRCEASSCTFSDSTCMSTNMSHQWSGSNPPPGVAPGCAPDFSSAWNSSPASMSHAFNLGYNMVAAWGGRPPSIWWCIHSGHSIRATRRDSFSKSRAMFPFSCNASFSWVWPWVCELWSSSALRCTSHSLGPAQLCSVSLWYSWH